MSKIENSPFYDHSLISHFDKLFNILDIDELTETLYPVAVDCFVDFWYDMYRGRGRLGQVPF